MNPTLNQPTQGGKNVDKEFQKQANKYITESDQLLKEDEQSLKRKIFNMQQAETLIHGDSKLSAIYNEMVKDGRDKFGYHYNETIINIIFNEYILHDNAYLQKYYMTKPKEKKRRDKSGIRQLHKDITGKEMNESIEINDLEVGDNVLFTDNNEELPGIVDEINIGDNTVNLNVNGEIKYNVPISNILDIQIVETTGAASSGSYSGPAAWSKSGKPAAKNPWNGGETVDYLTESSFFENMYSQLINESFDNMNEDHLQTKEEKVLFILKNAGDKYKNIEELDRLSDQQIDQIYKSVESTTGINEKAESKAQQRFMGMVHGLQTGDIKPSEVSSKVERVAKEMKPSDVTDFASTKHDKLPEKIDEANPIDVNVVASQIVKQSQHQNTINFDEIANTAKKYNIDLVQLMSKIGEIKKSGKIVESTKLEDESFINDKSSEFGSAGLKDMSKENLDIIKTDIEKGVYESIIDQQQDSIISDQQDSMKMKPTQSQSKISGMEMGINEDGRCRRDEFEVGGECHKKNKHNPNVNTNKSSLTTDDKNKSQTGGKPVNYYNEKFRKERMEREKQKKSEENKHKSGVNESLDFYLNELENFDKQIDMISEDRRPSALVDLDRLKKQNASNYKQAIGDSFIKDAVSDLEKAEEQITYVGDDPQKLGEDIEKEVLDKTKGNSFKNVGDSANEKGDEIPKRNLTAKENEQLMLDRGLGMQDIVYSNKPSEKFEERMKADMGDRIYDDRQKKMEYRAKAPMYNKDTMPTEKGDIKNQYNKFDECYITGKYRDVANNTKFVDFKLNESIISESVNDNWIELNLSGLGNKFNSNVSINESVSETIDNNKFYYDGINVYQIKVSNSLNESTEKQIKDQSFDKMKHLLGYNPSKFTDVKNIKKNRGF